MYEELIGDLRYCGKGDCNGCRRYAKDTKYCYDLLCDAADAIEELSLVAESNERSAARWADTAGMAVEQIPQWIPVTERLPGRGWVLCKCRAKIHEVLSLRDGYWYHDPQHQYMSGFVTHWMPLPPAPEPPKEET